MSETQSDATIRRTELVKNQRSVVSSFYAAFRYRPEPDTMNALIREAASLVRLVNELNSAKMQGKG